MSKTSWISSLVLVIAVALGLAAYRFCGKPFPNGNGSTKPCPARPINATPLATDPNVLPGGRPEDIALAQSNPDEYAWRLFLAINRQALEGKRGFPDPTHSTVREYESDKPVIWETWALSSGGRNGRRLSPKNTSEVFKDFGRHPGIWESLGQEQKSLELFPSKQETGAGELVESKMILTLAKTGSSARDIQNTKEQTLLQPMFIQPNEDEAAQGIGEEVRMNRATFEHVVAHNLYNIEGLEEAFRKFRDSPDPNNPEKIDVPAPSQEIKAKWVRIREEDKPRYHWRSLKRKNGEIQIWGLTALHITTKDLQDWFWSDFEHKDYLDLPVHSVGTNFGQDIVDRGEIESRDTTTRGETPTEGARDCNNQVVQGLRGETVGTKWENYRLRGTQTTFTCFDPYTCDEVPTVLANTQLERGFQQTSSCITCHARASIGERAAPENFLPNRLDVFLSVQFLRPSGFLLVGAIGKKDDNWFLNPNTKKVKYAQTDFMWTLPERAMSTKAKPNEPVRRPTCPMPCPVPSPSKPGP